MKILALTVIIVATLGALATIESLGADNIPTIKFDLGQNIVETARKSGAPRYANRNVAGLVSYDLNTIPLDVPARYSRPGYEVSATHLYSFTMYADHELNNGLAVETAALLFDTTALNSHESAKAFVENLNSQFNRGKWKRYIDELCPAVTGRSAFLDETGQPADFEACPLDPQHRLSSDDWITLMRSSRRYAWIGDGVLATLTVGFSETTGAVRYSIDLDFSDFAMKERRADAELARKLAEGDAKGWNRTEKHKAKRLALKSRIKLLEENAVRRGDTVVPR